MLFNIYFFQLKHTMIQIALELLSQILQSDFKKYLVAQELYNRIYEKNNNKNLALREPL